MKKKKNAHKTGIKQRFRQVMNALQAYIYGRWTRGYISLLRNQIIPRLNPRRKRKLADGFHCKVLTHDHARAIITIDRDISERDLEQIIPYPAARNKETTVTQNASKIFHKTVTAPYFVCLWK